MDFAYGSMALSLSLKQIWALELLSKIVKKYLSSIFFVNILCFLFIFLHQINTTVYIYLLSYFSLLFHHLFY